MRRTGKAIGPIVGIICGFVAGLIGSVLGLAIGRLIARSFFWASTLEGNVRADMSLFLEDWYMNDKLAFSLGCLGILGGAFFGGVYGKDSEGIVGGFIGGLKGAGTMVFIVIICVVTVSLGLSIQ